MGSEKAAALALSAIILLALICCLVLFVDIYPRFLDERSREALLDGLYIGEPRGQVIGRLGTPNRTASTQTEAVRDGIEYLPRPTRRVGKEVLIYYRHTYKLYVYIDRTDQVEYIFLART